MSGARTGDSGNPTRSTVFVVTVGQRTFYARSADSLVNRIRSPYTPEEFRRISESADLKAAGRGARGNAYRPSFTVLGR